MADTRLRAANPSMQDPVTGLLNRSALVTVLRERVPEGQGSVILLDIDGFRRATQKLNRAQLDRLLSDVAGRLRSKSDERSTLYRYAGDAFCLLLADPDRDGAAAVAETLKSAVGAEPFLVAASEKSPAAQVALTATAAVAAFPHDGRSPTKLIETAELALLAGKHLGSNRVAIAGRLDPGVLAQIGVFRSLPCPVMVGRIAEQSRLRQAAQDVRHVGPTFSLVTGPAGIGKTRLVQELCRWARTEKFVVMSGSCQEARSTLPYAILAECIENLLVTDRTLAVAALDRMTPKHRAALAVVVRDLPPAAAPVSLQLPEYGRLIFEAFGALFDELAKSGPLLLSLDEAEYADPATFDVLEYAAARRIPFLVVSASNQEPADFQRTAAGAFYKTRAGTPLLLQIAPLSAEEVDQLLRAILPDADIARPLADRMIERATGNPLYLEETLRALLLRGRVRLVEGRWKLPSLEPGDLPRDLEAAIRSVSEALPVRANSLLTRAAVIGDHIDPDLLQEVLGQDEMEMLDLIDEARRSRLLVASDTSTDLLLFPAAHSRRIRLAATPAAERREIHGRVGVVQEARHGGDVSHLADELAFHYSRSGNQERARHFDLIARQRAALIQPPRAEGIRRARLEPIKEPLSPKGMTHAVAMLRHFHGALKVGRLYPQWSQVSTTFVTQLREELQSLLSVSPGITIAQATGGPQLNGVPCALPAAAEFAAILDERLIESVTFLRSFDLAGLDSVVRAFMEPVDRGRAEPDLWDRFLTREGLQAVDIVQKAFQARDERTIRIEAREDKPIPPEELPAVRDAVRSLKAAVENLKLYPPGHALVEETAAACLEALMSLMERLPSVTFGAVESELVLNGRPADLKFFGDGGTFILREIDQRRLKSVSVRKGLKKDEVSALIGFLATPLEEQASAEQRLRGQFEHIVFGSHQYERAKEGTTVEELTPPPKPIRSEIRAKEFLALPYEEFLSKDLQEQFANLVEVLSYGARRPLAEELVARLGSHFHDPVLLHRRTAYRTLVRSLTFASPTSRQVEVAQSASSLRRRLQEDMLPDNFRAAAEVLYLWIPAAATAGCLRELAEIAGPVLRRRASSTETPAEIAAACDKSLHLIPDTGAYAVLLAAAEKPRAEERMSAVSILLAIGGRAVERLVEVLVSEPDRSVRRNIAMAIGLAADAVSGPLTKALSADVPVERLARALEVAEPLITPALLAHFAELADKGKTEVRREILSTVERWPAATAQSILRRLIASAAEEPRRDGIESATRMKLDLVSADVGRLLEGTEDERLIRACSRYFAAVPNATVVPILTKIIEHKPKFFGLVKGFSEETRAEASKALEAQPGRKGESPEKKPDAVVGDAGAKK